MLFVGQLDANVVALDMKTGREMWKTPIEDWHNGYSITSAPLYYDGIVYSGISGGELGIRGAGPGPIWQRYLARPQRRSDSPRGSDLEYAGARPATRVDLLRDGQLRSRL
jgi:outer membrane protein assembly factor BamB